MQRRRKTAEKSPKNPTIVARMNQDYVRLKRDPLPYITAEPLPNNLLEWHYVVKGPDDTPFDGGYYHGILLFPREFPFKPPAIYMLTSNGRFKTNTRLCLSISDFHPNTWNPTWCVGTILTGLLSFMLETTPTLGSFESSIADKEDYAKKSLEFNMRNKYFRELFPEIYAEISRRLQQTQQVLTGGTTPIGETIDNNVQMTKRKVRVPYARADAAHNRANNTNTNSTTNVVNNCPAIISNALILISFTVFSIAITYVITNIN